MNVMAQAPSAAVSGPKLDNRRVLAALVDLVALFVGGFVLGLVVGLVTGGDAFGGSANAIFVAWALYYYFAFESGDGQTPGKKLLKLRVVRADGGPVGMREIAIRTILRLVDGLLLYLVGLIVMLATGERRQRLGDLAAGTIVVDASAPAAPEVAPAAAAPAAVPAPMQEGPMRTPEVPEAVKPEPAVEPEPAVQQEPLVEPAPQPEPQAQEIPSLSQEIESFSPAPAEAPSEEAVEEPAQEPVDQPAGEPFGGLASEPVDQPAGEPFAGLASEPVAEPFSEPVSEPAPEPTSEPVSEPVAEEAPAGDAGQDEQVNVRSVETVSAIDFIMGGDTQAPVERDQPQGDQGEEGDEPSDEAPARESA
jgi:uncharacterized RDD family membrane protein YckC